MHKCYNKLAFFSKICELLTVNFLQLLRLLLITTYEHLDFYDRHFF
jgi:hypothetical protein